MPGIYPDCIVPIVISLSAFIAARLGAKHRTTRCWALVARSRSFQMLPVASGGMSQQMFGASGRVRHPRRRLEQKRPKCATDFHQKPQQPRQRTESRLVSAGISVKSGPGAKDFLGTELSDEKAWRGGYGNGRHPHSASA